MGSLGRSQNDLSTALERPRDGLGKAPVRASAKASARSQRDLSATSARPQRDLSVTSARPQTLPTLPFAAAQTATHDVTVNI